MLGRKMKTKKKKINDPHLNMHLFAVTSLAKIIADKYRPSSENAQPVSDVRSGLVPPFIVMLMINGVVWTTGSRGWK